MTITNCWLYANIQLKCIYHKLSNYFLNLCAKLNKETFRRFRSSNILPAAIEVLLSLRLMLFREPDHLMKKPLQIIFIGCAVFALCAFAAAQTGKKNARPVRSEPVQKQGTAEATNSAAANPEPTPDKNVKTNKREQTPTIQVKESTVVPTYFYEFSRPGFPVSHIWIEHDDNGSGTIKFKKGIYDEELIDSIQVSPAALDRINTVLKALDFVNSTEDYQYVKDYSHLGNITLRIKKDGRERTAKFNWTEYKDAKQLADEYRKISNQYVWMSDINIDRENQPLDAPQQMDAFDSMLRRNEISDPQQMIPFLKELSNDERIPLIARNHATRLVAQIEKAKK